MVPSIRLLVVVNYEGVGITTYNNNNVLQHKSTRLRHDFPFLKPPVERTKSLSLSLHSTRRPCFLSVWQLLVTRQLHNITNKVTMKSPTLSGFVILVIISACAAAWTASISLAWSKVLIPMAMRCANITKAWIQVFSDPSKYQLREPYNLRDILCHPYFHESLDLTIFDRYVLVASKYAGMFAVLFIRVFPSACRLMPAFASF